MNHQAICIHRRDKTPYALNRDRPKLALETR